MSDVAISLTEVVAGYGSGTVLDGISLEVKAGKTTALVGPNGAGKSTTLRVISGVLGVSGGVVSIPGAAETGRSRRRIRPGIALTPEGRRLFPEMTVRDNLLVGAFEHGGGRAEVERTLAEVCDLFPLLRERAQARGGELSGGQQSLVAIGRALMRKPQILLLDEPTLGLSPKFCAEIAADLKSIATGAVTIVVVEQNAAVALDVADYAYVLQDGRVVAKGESDSLRGSERLSAHYFGQASKAAS